MNLLDILLLVVVLAYALSGFAQGFVIGAASTIGLLLGGLLGVFGVPILLESQSPSVGVSLLALAIVLVCAVIGQAVAATFGHMLSARITWTPVRAIDSTAGAALSVIAVLIVAWALGFAISGARIQGLTPAVRDSAILRAVDGFLPPVAEETLRSFTAVVDASIFPRYLEPFSPEEIREVPAPEGSVLADPEVQAAFDSTVRVLGSAPSCGRQLEGSGFVYASERVMTNAHVVAGVDEPRVEVGGDELDATVVLYDPAVDIAVLAVPGLDAAALPFGSGAEGGDPAAVLGFPENGPFNADAARIRGQQDLRGPDIYGDGAVSRQVFSIRAPVRPGNSGGPLVAPDGAVLGVIFAASVSDSDTGYALTAEQVMGHAAEGETATATVDTQGCA